jgi:hypothetical protein
LKNLELHFSDIHSSSSQEIFVNKQGSVSFQGFDLNQKKFLYNTVCFFEKHDLFIMFCGDHDFLVFQVIFEFLVNQI